MSKPCESCTHADRRTTDEGELVYVCRVGLVGAKGRRCPGYVARGCEGCGS